MTASRTILAALTVLAAAALAGPKADLPGRAPKRPQARPQPAAAEAPRPAPTRPPAKQPGGLAPLPLELPPPQTIGTPMEPPPGTRVKIPKGQWTPRKAFLAPKGVRNVAFRKPVTCSETEPVIGELALVTDGDKEAQDGVFLELAQGVQYVQIDLGKPHKLYAIVVWHEHRDRRVYHDMVVQVADDRDCITNVRTLFNNDHDNSAGLGIGEDWGYFETHEGLLVDAQGVQGRYVRLYSNGSTGDDQNRYTEVEVYALPAGADTAGKAKPPAKPAR